MRTVSFEEYWSQNWKPSGQPEVFDAAMREIALKSWNAAVLAASNLLVRTDSGIRLMAGELTAGELCTTKAIPSCYASDVARQKAN